MIVSSLNFEDTDYVYSKTGMYIIISDALVLSVLFDGITSQTYKTIYQ